MQIENLIKRLFVSLVLLTSVGTLVHDTRLNKAYVLALPASIIGANIAAHANNLNESASHTHVDKSFVAQVVQEATPRMQPRDNRKHFSPRHSTRNNANFGVNGVIWPQV